MADIREILATDFISDSREDLNNNFNLIASDFAGNAFPNNPTIGMVCYRTDQKKAYRYVEGGKWKVEGAVLTVESENPDDQGNVNLPLVTDEQIANILGGVDVGGVEPSILESQVLFFIQQEVAKAQAQIATQVDERVAQAKRDILNTSFPVGGIYLSTDNRNPHDLFGGEWERIADGRVLWGSNGNNVGEVREAGLPNIFSEYNGIAYYAAEQYQRGSGALYATRYYTDKGNLALSERGAVNLNAEGFIDSHNCFDASRSNPIYGASTTVQPPALCVNIWKRIS